MLGEFPSADDETLIPLRWIESAINNAATRPPQDLPAPDCALQATRETPVQGSPLLAKEGVGGGGRGASRVRMAADIARFGDDSTVIGWRVGSRLIQMEVVQGCDLMAVAQRIAELAYRDSPESIAIDVIGIGAGVVDRLREMDIQGVQGVNVSHRAWDQERFANRRAELYWGLRERFRSGDIELPKDDLLVQELAAVKYLITARGQIQIESKDRMKKRMGRSPDRADMLAMLFDDSLSWPALDVAPSMGGGGPSPAERLRAEMRDW